MINKSISENSHISEFNEPNLFRNIFPYVEIPKVDFNNEIVPMDLPNDIWITDTTFRDGQQSMPPFTVDQMVMIYELLNKLDNKSGIIRQTEFFLYTEKDRKAAEKCMEKGYDFPEITSWIRANKKDFKIVKEMNIKETGILMSCSDYHIFKKLKLTRKQAFNKYIEIAEDAFENGIIPRCHLEDITRADFFGFVVPLINRLSILSKQSGVPFKIRACDTLGLGLSYQGVALPRSIPAIIHGLRQYTDLLPSDIEWHGHNDFYAAIPNAVAAWLYGCSSINTTILGIGERTGNCPLEAMVIEYGQIKGNTKNMNLRYITEIANYMQDEFGYDIPPKTPYVGKEFNVTRAGIHADGVLKDEEIYNIFDTEKILNRPVLVAINEYSGLAGIAAWINTFYRLKEEDKIDKKDHKVHLLKEWVENEYKNGRTTMISNEELVVKVKKIFPEIFEAADIMAI